MWNRISGKSNHPKDDLPSQSYRRNGYEQGHPARSIASSNSNEKYSSWAGDRDSRGFKPTSTSYSSTTRGQYPGTASASIVSSHATTFRSNNDEPYMAPGLDKNANIADQMPRSSLSRSSRDQGEARDIKEIERDKRERSDAHDQDLERRENRDKRDKKDNGLRRSENGFGDEVGTSRGHDDFPYEVASSGFSQFPGQYDGAIPGSNGAPPRHPAMSSHVQDQFPGQFPTQSSAPYRPPLAANEGGPGLAAEYYGDYGQSVAEQPGNRVNTPSLIIGAEPHLQPALAVAAPPPEPSASGAVGAAASFFSGEFEGDEIASTHSQQNPSAHAPSQTRPNSNYPSSSAPVITTTGGAAIGSAAGYFIDSQTSSHQQHQDTESFTGGAPSGYSAITTHQPQSQTQDSQYPSSSRPPKPGKQSSQSSNIAMYAAEAAGAAGSAAAAYEHNHHSLNHDLSSTPQYSTTPMAQRHRNHGPFNALVNFFKDPEGVAQFEEYSQIIGVCRHCFAPGSSPKDAPRKHLYKRRRSNERYGSSTRIDKDSRYYSSENEGRRKNNKSWLATGLAGYGLAEAVENLFKEKNDNDDTYSVKTGRVSPDGKDRRTRRQRRSKDRVEVGITGDGRSDRKEPRDDTSNGTKRTTYSTKRQSRTRSRSQDRKTGFIQAAIGAEQDISGVASSSRRRSRSPRGTPIKGKHNSQEILPERRHKTNKKKKGKGFFGFANGSSSSSSVDLAYTGSQDKHRNSKRSNGKSKEDKKAEAAVLGLSAAAAALALNDGRQGHKKKGVRELVGAKETKDRHGHSSARASRSKVSSAGNVDDEVWESAAEDDYESVISDLAYGAPVRRDSRGSLSSESSGTDKWGWRWGSKKSRRASPPRRKSSDYSNFPVVAGTAGAGLTGAAMTFPDRHQGSAMDSTSSLPLQHVYPVPTSDPSRFDVGHEGSIGSSNRPAMSSRPEAVPLQHPRPIAPVSAAIYSSQAGYDHSYSAPTGPALFYQTPYHQHPGRSDARHSTHETSIPGSFPRFEQAANDTAGDFGIRRRGSSPARLGEDSKSSSMTPQRRLSGRDDSSAVRFDLTEEQEDRERCERRRKRKQDKERREAEEREQMEKDSRASKGQPSKKSGSKTKPEEVPDKSSENSWAGPAAAGVIGAAIGAAAATDRSRSEETREERREHRRRERELEDEEYALSKSERRRRQRERDDQEAAFKERGRLLDEISASREFADHQERSPERKGMSVWQEAASTKRSSSHENYGAFFTPLELINKPSDQVKITSANADAVIDLEQFPRVVTVEPKRIHDLSDSPTFSFADNDDRIKPSELSFPWQVPKLRLVEPTPPSTRDSTPVLRPKDAGDEGFEEPRKEFPSSKVKWADDQIREYTVIAPKEDHDDFIEPPFGEIGGTEPVDLPGSTHQRNLPGHETYLHNDSTRKSSPTSYGADSEFAATLAASAEDAGFDPSIVINNPTYRRRDSPPGSNERSMPGGFEDENEPRPSKSERKRKAKDPRRQGQNDDFNGQDDDSIVQDIISQMEENESRPSNQVPSETFDDGWESTKKTKSRKSKKGRKAPEFRDDTFETSRTANKALDSESPGVYESPTGDLSSIASISNEAENGRPSRKKSTPESTGLDDPASNVAATSTTEASKGPKPQDRRKGSIWDQVLGNSTRSSSQENGKKNVVDEASLEDFEDPKKSRESMEPKPTPDREDDPDSKERSNTGGTSPQVSGRISQDLPAEVYTPVPSGRASLRKSLINSQSKGANVSSAYSNAGSVARYLDHGTEQEQVEEKYLVSSSGMRIGPPPPPNIRAEREELSDPLQTTSLPISPQVQRFSEAESSNPPKTMPVLPSSPTAVPFHFRRPGRSSSSARSLSQTPLPSNKSANNLPPKQKTRSRSTDCKSSKEIRPLWPVERHKSHQEPAPDQIYPSFPSSHTTSRSSSVHDLEGSEHQERGKNKSSEAEHAQIEAEIGPVLSTGSHPIQSDLLDLQQSTPTVSSFQGSNTTQDLPPTQASRDSSSNVITEASYHESSSTLKSKVLGAILGGSAAVALNGAMQNDDYARHDLSREENEDFEHGLDDMVLDTMTAPFVNDTLDQEEDSIPQKSKRAKKKKKRKVDQAEQETVHPFPAGAAEAKPSTNATEVEPLSPEIMRQIQEQDVQDAVDSWFPSASSSYKGKRGRKGKGRTLVDKVPEESGPSSNTFESPSDTLEITAPAQGQESDSLTREMSSGQNGDIMATASQGANNDENTTSQYATAVDQEPSKIQAEENRSQSSGKKNSSDLKSLPPDDLPLHEPRQDGLQTKTLSQDELLQDTLPKSDLHHETLPKLDFPREEIPQLDNSQKTQPQDDFPPVNLPRADFSTSPDPEAGSLQDFRSGPDSLPKSPPSTPAGIAFVDTCLEQGHRNVLESPSANPASQKELDRGDLATATSPLLELSPRAIPLPDSDDDHDLLDELPVTPVTSSFNHLNKKGMEVTAKIPFDVPHIPNPSTGIPELQKPPQGSPSQVEQLHTGDYSSISSNANPKHGEKVEQSLSLEDNQTSRIHEKNRPLPKLAISTTLEEDWATNLNDEPAMEVPQEKSETMEDEWEGFTGKKKRKKGKKVKQNFSVENGETTETQGGQESLINMAASEGPEDHEAMELIDESAVELSQPKTEPLEDEITGFDGKKKIKKGEIFEPSFPVENNKTVMTEKNESQTKAAASEAPEDPDAVGLIDELAVHKPEADVVKGDPLDLIDVLTKQTSKPDVVKDKSEGFDSERKGNEVEKQTSDTSNLGPGSDETEHQFDQRPATGNDMNDRPTSLATTATFQEVGAMLGLGKVGKGEVSIGVESKEAFPTGSQAEHKLQKPSKDQLSGSNERDLPALYEPQTPQFEHAMGNAHGVEMSPSLETPVAHANAAQVVQDILAKENNAESPTDHRRETMMTATGLEETATDRPTKEDKLDLDAPKQKKKGKKERKNEAFLLEEPETIEPAEAAVSPNAKNTSLEQEPTTDKPIEEDKLDWDAPKKKKKGKKGKKNEAFLWGEPETIGPAEAAVSPAATNTSLEQEPAVDKPIEEDELDRDASKKKKKSKKGKKNEAFSWKEPEKREPTEAIGSSDAMNASLEREPEADNSIEEYELDRDAPKKKKKSNKVKKNGVFSLDESEIMEPAEVPDPLAAKKLLPSEQAPEVQAIDEIFSKQSKKDKKCKKGKRKGVSRAISDFRDEDEPNVIPTKVPQEEDKAENLPAIASDDQEIEPSIMRPEVPRDDNKVDDIHASTSDSRDEVVPSVVPTELLQDDNQVEDCSAVDRRSVTSDMLGGTEPKFVPPESPKDDQEVEDLPADGMLSASTEIHVPREVSESAVPTELAQHSVKEQSREAPSEQEHDSMLPKGKKDKKRSKKSKKSNAFPLNGDETPTLGDGQMAGTKDLGKEGPEQKTPSNVDVLEDPEEMVQKTPLEQEKDLLPAKKSKKKSKKFNAFSLDSEVTPTIEDESILKSKDLEKEALEQTLPSGVDEVRKLGTFIESLPNEKKVREETEEAQPFEWKTEDIAAQSEQNSGQELKEPTHGHFDNVSARAAAPETPHKATSSVMSPLDQPARVSEETTTNHTNELEGNIVLAIENDTDSPHSLNSSKKDRKKAQKPRPLDRGKDEVSQEPTAVLKENSASEDPGEPSIVPVSDGEAWSKPETSGQEIESTEIVQPDTRSKEDQGYQEGVLGEQPIQAGNESHTMVQAEQGGSFAIVEKGKNSGKTKNETLAPSEWEKDQFPADEKELWVTATSDVQGNEQTSKKQPGNDLDVPRDMQSKPKESAKELTKEQASILTEPGAVDEAKDEDLPRAVPVQSVEEPERQYDEAHLDEPKIKDLSSSAAPASRETVEKVRNLESVTTVEPRGSLDRDERIPAVQVEMLNAQEQREYDEEYAKELERAVPKTEPVADFEPLGGLDKDKQIPAADVEMLDAQGQRDYNEEYAKELERQLSPSQESERADPSRGQADTLLFSQPSMSSVMEKPYEEEHRPLAQPPALEDIIEESSSRPESVQGSPTNRDDDFSPSKSTKKPKKGKKGKKQQPVIWEDETATPPLEPENDQGTKPSATSSEGPGPWDTDAARLVDSEEPIDQQSLEDRPMASPIGDFNAAHNELLTKEERSGDYFAIQPSRPAEEDVGREEFGPALSTEPSHSSEDRSSARELQTGQDGHPRDDAFEAYNQQEGLDNLATDALDKSRTKAEPAEGQVEDNSDPAAVGNAKKGKKAKKKASATERSPQAVGQEDPIDQTQDLKIPLLDTLSERTPSRQHSLRLPSHEDEPLSVAEGRPASRGRSRGMEEVAAAVGLGVGALAAENLLKGDSKTEGRLHKNEKDVGTWADFEAERGESDSHLDRREMATEERANRRTPESESAIRAWQHHQATSPRSPPSASYEALEDHPVEGDIGPSSEMLKYRDSAIYVSGSPTMSEEIPHHRAVRDSGYPDTETSPVVNDELANSDNRTQSETGVTAGEMVGHAQHRRSRAHETDEPLRSESTNPFEVSVEADSDHNVSISRSKERRKRSRRRSGAAYNSDDSADSGFDIQRRRRRQAMAAEPRKPSPVSSTTKDRSSALFDSSPSAREETGAKPQDPVVRPRYEPLGKEPTWSFDRGGSPQQQSREASRESRSANVLERASEPTSYDKSTANNEDTRRSLFGGPRSNGDELLSPPKSRRSSESRSRQRLNTNSENSADGSPLHKKDKRAVSDVGSPESGVKGRRMRSPPVNKDVAEDYVSIDDPISRQPWPAAGEEQRAVEERSRSRNSDQLSNLSSRHSALPGIPPRHREGEYRTASAGSMQSEHSIHAIIRTPDQFRSASGLSYHSSGTPTPPLRHVDRSASGDLRGASKKFEAKNHAKSSSELEAELDIGIPSSSTYDPVTDKGKSHADMADVYEGWGDVRGQSPMSPTRPPSMRKRQSMHLLDLETRLDQIVSENRLLASQKLTAEKALQEQAHDHSQERHAYEEAMQEHKMYLARKDNELSELKQIIEQLHEQAAHLTEVNEGLASSRGVDEEREQSYSQLRAEHAHAHQQWQQSTRELENLKYQHTQLSAGMEDIVRHEVTVALEEKNLELRQLQSEFENAKQQVRNLRQQLLASKNSDDFVERDEDYFDSQCQALCQHVQQWVLRFSKFSDMKACYLASKIKDEKIVDRMENAILDGSDVDDYLFDRVKRRDVFMSVVMTMIWEFIFTRYLFGMDREQRQKLKNLEKTLQEVGPISAVHKWRATTLTLLMKREAFENQRATDTEAVVQEIYDTLATFLPPPSHLVGQIQDSLRKVIDMAVDLSIEMRTQRAEYSMLPPLQPEYDTNGDLARKVYFSALTMNERSGATSSNEALQEQHAIVRMVLFPLVVKNEDDDEQMVVCPAQVLTAEGLKGKKTVRVMSAQGGRSEASYAGSDVRMEGGMI